MENEQNLGLEKYF